MGNYTLNIQARSWGVTPIQNIFIDEYLPYADGNYVKVYLLGLFEAFNQGSVSGDTLSKKLGLLESDVIKAWEYWDSKGLVKILKTDSGDTTIDFLNILDTYAPPQGSSSYNPEHVRIRLNNPNTKDMFMSIEKLLGRTLSYNESSMYLSWLDDFGFSPEVILLLIQYCKAKGKTDSRYIEKVALSWHDRDIKTIEDAQNHISRYEENYSNYRSVLDFLGLKETDIMKPQEDFLNKWFNTWNFSKELILEACKICSLKINEPNFSYIDGILSNWYKKGVKTIKDVEKANTSGGKGKSKNAKFKAPVTTFNSYDQRSYDMDELEKKLLGRDGETQNE